MRGNRELFALIEKVIVEDFLLALLGWPVEVVTQLTGAAGVICQDGGAWHIKPSREGRSLSRAVERARHAPHCVAEGALRVRHHRIHQKREDV